MYISMYEYMFSKQSFLLMFWKISQCYNYLLFQSIHVRTSPVSVDFLVSTKSKPLREQAQWVKQLLNMTLLRVCLCQGDISDRSIPSRHGAFAATRAHAQVLDESLEGRCCIVLWPHGGSRSPQPISQSQKHVGRRWQQVLSSTCVLCLSF